MKKSSKKAIKFKTRRRMEEIESTDSVDSFDFMETPAALTMEKCTWTDREAVCMRYTELTEGTTDGVQIEMEYSAIDLEDTINTVNLQDVWGAGTFRTNEWTIEDLYPDGAQIYECHDNFELFDEVCIEKWQLIENDITLLLKGERDFEFTLHDAIDVSTGWTEVTVIGMGDRHRVCRMVEDNRLCVEMRVVET